MGSNYKTFRVYLLGLLVEFGKEDGEGRGWGFSWHNECPTCTALSGLEPRVECGGTHL